MRIKSLPAILLIILTLLTVLSACASRKPTIPPSNVSKDKTLEDLVNFPQNLEIYAKNAGAAKELLPLYRQRELADNFVQILFGPWQMKRTSIKKSEMLSPFRHARGFKNASIRWQQAEWDAMRANASPAAFPSMHSFGITLRNTDLREMPTHEARFSEPTPDIKENPFDYFQQSLLPIGTPLLLVHKSEDGRWYYVECPVAGGWVDANDVGITGENFRNIWRHGKYAALIRDKVNLPGTGLGNRDAVAGIGTLLPLKNILADGSMDVYIPVKDRNGLAGIAETRLTKNEAAPFPMLLTPGNVAKVGNQMLGQAYGWGGILGLRDCSAMIRELFTPFGIWLPRNSVAQAKRGSVISLAGMPASEKAGIIKKDGVPFLSLVGMRGHITLYIGIWKGQPAIFHNAWGLRIIKDGNDDERYVIGKAVITSISPGMELENLYRPLTFTDRLRTLSTPGK